MFLLYQPAVASCKVGYTIALKKLLFGPCTPSFSSSIGLYITHIQANEVVHVSWTDITPMRRLMQMNQVPWEAFFTITTPIVTNYQIRSFHCWLLVVVYCGVIIYRPWRISGSVWDLLHLFCPLQQAVFESARSPMVVADKNGIILEVCMHASHVAEDECL